MKLTKQQIRSVLDEHSVKHTDECRKSPGNVKGSGGHWPPRNFLDLGGYRCICDWMERVIKLYKMKQWRENFKHRDICDPVIKGHWYLLAHAAGWVCQGCRSYTDVPPPAYPSNEKIYADMICCKACKKGFLKSSR